MARISQICIMVVSGLLLLGEGNARAATRIIRLEGGLAFGNVNVGQTSEERYWRIYNDGNSNLTVTGISYPSGFEGTTVKYSFAIAPGARQKTNLLFKPTEDKTYNGTVTVTSDRTEGTNTIACSGTTVDDIIVFPDTHYGDRTETSGATDDPVNTATGNFIYSQMDMRIPSRGESLGFECFYNSLDQNAGLLGTGWTYSYNLSVSSHTFGERAGLVSVRWQDGRVDYWYYRGDAGICTPASKGLHSELHNLGGAWMVKTKSLDTYYSNSYRRLQRMVDKNGNEVRIAYDEPRFLWVPTSVTGPTGRGFLLKYNSEALLESVTDSTAADRVVRYSYTDGRLTRVTDLLGNQTQYEYDENGLLKGVVDQRGVRTVEMSSTARAES